MDPAKEDEDDYSKSLTSPLSPNECDKFIELDNHLTYLDIFHLDPKKVMTQLVENISKTETSTDLFHAEIKELVRSIVESEAETFKTRPEKSNRHSGDWRSFFSLFRFFSSSSEQKLLKNKMKRIKYLKIKYGLAENNVENSVPLSILKYVFPEYYCQFLGVASEGIPQTVILAGEGTVVFFPEAMKQLSFGGLIPTSNYCENDEFKEARRKIIMLVLHFVSENDPSVTMRVHQIMLRKVIETGILADTRRIRVLEKYGVINIKGQLLYTLEEQFIEVNKINLNLCKVDLEFFD